MNRVVAIASTAFLLTNLLVPQLPARSHVARLTVFDRSSASTKANQNAFIPPTTFKQHQASPISLDLQQSRVGGSLVLNDRFSFWASSLVFSPDGRTLACAGRYEVKGKATPEKGARLWQLTYDKNQNVTVNLDPRIFDGYAGVVGAIAIAPDGHTIATGSYDTFVKLRHFSQTSVDKPRVLVGQKREIYTVSFSPDGQILASAGKDQKVFLWNPTTGELHGTLTEQDDINSVSISPNSRILASGSRDKTIKLWDLTTKKLLRTLIDHDGEVNAVAFSPDGNILASGSNDKTIKLWNVRTGELLRTLVKHSDKVNTVAFSPDGRTLASGSEDMTINLWDVFDGKLQYTRGKHSAAVYSVAFNPIAPYFASGGNDGKVRLWTY